MKYSNELKELKLEVLSLVSKFAYDGTLEENIDNIPRMLIPGSVPKFRCCVYKEREILRERVMLAANKSLYGEKNNKGVVTVLKAACEGCPINRFNVTANCQRCLTKNCLSACKFDAISMSSHSAYIDQDKCRECGQCAKACPYNAISDTQRPCMRACPVNAISFDENKRVKIKYDVCINCGACVTACPFGALSDTSSIVDIINDIKAGKDVYAMVAPAIEGQFDDASIGAIREAVKKLGFKDLIEVSLGADAVSIHEADELIENKKNGMKMTTSCCPAFLSLIHKHFPEIESQVSSTVSPMTATARYIKYKYENAVTVFIGPCIAKKFEVQNTEDTADYVMTFDELNAMFDSQNIDPTLLEGEFQDGSLYGKGYAVSGGVAKAVVKAIQEKDDNIEVTCTNCAGIKECKKALTLLKAGKIPYDIIEGMICEGGCVHGPSSLLPYNQVVKNRTKLLNKADKRGINENIEKNSFDNIDMTRKYKGQ